MYTSILTTKRILKDSGLSLVIVRKVSSSIPNVLFSGRTGSKVKRRSSEPITPTDIVIDWADSV